MSNPVFNEATMKQASQTWAPPVAGTHTAPQPATDGPVSTWKKAMTVQGTVTATAVLFVIFMVAAVFGWTQATGPQVRTEAGELVDTYQFPAIATVGIIVGFVAVLAAYFKPQLAKWLGPVYSIGYGFAVGAISKGYETFQDGIVLQAAGATVAVFAVMLVMYRTRIIKVTENYRRVVIGATLGIMLLYLVSFVMSLFGAEIAFINSPSWIGIGFSVLVCALAAANLALDFDLIERGTEMRLPKDYEWVAALGLLVTLVWLYLELLRLLSKLRQ